MATVILKSFAGIDFPREDGTVLSLKGGCIMNEVSDKDLEFLRKGFGFAKMEDEGHVVVGAKGNDSAIADTITKAVTKQKADIKKNETTTQTTLVEN